MQRHYRVGSTPSIDDVSGVVSVRSRAPRWTDQKPRTVGFYWARPVGLPRHESIVLVNHPPSVPDGYEWSDAPIARPLEPDEVADEERARLALATERAQRKGTTIEQEVRRLT